MSEQVKLWPAKMTFYLCASRVLATPLSKELSVNGLVKALKNGLIYWPQAADNGEL